MEKQTLLIECLVLAQSFEIVWVYYCLSSGKIYENECREAAIQFLEKFASIGQIEPRIEPKIEEFLIPKMRIKLSDLTRNLEDWARNQKIYPYDTLFESHFNLRFFLAGLIMTLLKELNIPIIPTMALKIIEQDYSARAIRWQAHLPKKALSIDPDRIVGVASNTSSIIVVGDIRRSQDLMTYAVDHKNFSERMVQFIVKTRELIEKHGGFFDKFTGDGFIVYFNEAVCRRVDLNYVESFLGFIEDEINFASPFFKEWERSIRKRPTAGIGLAIGADIGNIKFEDIQDHLVAVGEPIVWAARMASAAESQEVLVNNLLFAALDGRIGLSFQGREGRTKAGEAFLAQVMTFTKQPNPDGP